MEEHGQLEKLLSFYDVFDNRMWYPRDWRISYQVKRMAITVCTPFANATGSDDHVKEFTVCIRVGGPVCLSTGNCHWRSDR
jgi:hypothetical protein